MVGWSKAWMYIISSIIIHIHNIVIAEHSCNHDHIIMRTTLYIFCKMKFFTLTESIKNTKFQFNRGRNEPWLVGAGGRGGLLVRRWQWKRFVCGHYTGRRCKDRCALVLFPRRNQESESAVGWRMIRRRPSHAGVMSRELSNPDQRAGAREQASGSSSFWVRVQSTCDACMGSISTTYMIIFGFIFLVFCFWHLSKLVSTTTGFGVESETIFVTPNEDMADFADKRSEPTILPQVLNMNNGLVAIASVPHGDPSLALVNASNGNILRSASLKGHTRVGVGYVPVAMARGKDILAVLLKNGMVHGLSPDTLNKRWSSVCLSKSSGKGGDTTTLVPGKVALFVHGSKVYTVGNDNVAAIDGKNGKVLWRKMLPLAHKAIVPTVGDDDDDMEATVPVHDYKLHGRHDTGNPKGTTQPGDDTTHVVSWQTFRTDVGRSLPHSSADAYRIQLLHYKRDQPGKDRARDHFDQAKPPNVVVVHTARGISVLQVSTGHVVTVLELPGPRYGGRGVYVDVDGDGNIDHIEALPGQPDEPLPLPECWGRVTSGIPATSGLWNGTICTENEEEEGGGWLSEVRVATPLVVHQNGDDVVRFGSTRKAGEGHTIVNLHTEGEGHADEDRMFGTKATLITATRSVVFLASTGDVSRYDAKGRLLWQVKTVASWRGDSFDNPQLSQLGMNALVVAGNYAMVILNMHTGNVQAEIILKHPLISPMMILPVFQAVYKSNGREAGTIHDGEAYSILTQDKYAFVHHTLEKEEDHGARYALFFGLVAVFAFAGMICGLVLLD